MDGSAQRVTGAAAEQPRRLRMRISAALVIKVASVCSFLLAWQLATTTGLISPLFLPSPGQIVAQAQELIANGELWSSVLISSQRVYDSFNLTVLVALTLDVIMGGGWTLIAIQD
jgi:taurine transport system permease protein